MMTRLLTLATLALLLIGGIAHSQVGPGLPIGPGGGGGTGTGGSGTVTSVGTSCQATGGPITVAGTVSTRFVLSASSPVTTTPYAIVAADACNNLLLNAGASVLTLASAATFGNGAYFTIDNRSGGTVTMNVTTSTLDGSSSVSIPSTGTIAFQSDGINYHYTQAPAGAGSGNVTGPAGAVSGHVATFNGATGLIIADGGALPAGTVTGPVSSVTGHAATFNGTTGQILQDGGALPTGTVTGPGSSVSGHAATFNGTTGQILQDGGVLPANLAPIHTGCQATGGDITGTGQTLSTRYVLTATSPVTTTPYTILAADACNLLVLNTGASVLTLPATATSGFGNGSYFAIDNRAAGAVTMNVTTNNLDGSTSVTIPSNATIAFQSDGTNYHYTQAPAAGGAGITQLTGDVTAGPGSGSQAATLTATTINRMAVTAPATGSTIAIGDGTTFTTTGTMTLATSNPGNTWTFPNTAGGTIAVLSTANVFSSGQTVNNNVSGSGLQLALRNSSAVATATTLMELGNSTAIGEVTMILNGGSFTGTPNQFTINSQGNMFLSGGGTQSIGVSSAGAASLLSLATDSTQTTATVCEDTTSHVLFFGSGTAGVCRGTSSARFKHGIAELAPGLDEILALHPVSYFLNADHGGEPDKRLYGFVAEETVAVLPGLTGSDAQGRPDSFDYIGVIPVLVKALQEQQHEIAQLKAAIGQRAEAR